MYGTMVGFKLSSWERQEQKHERHSLLLNTQHLLNIDTSSRLHICGFDARFIFMSL